MDTNERRYLKEIGRSMAAFTVMVAVSIWLLKGHEHSPLRYLVALLPVIPSAFAIRAAIRFFRGLDELQRRIQFEAMAFSFLGTCLISLNWGVLQRAGLPHADVVWVTLLMLALYTIGILIACRRYQ
ncbi:MAG: hypothetical protein DMG77_08720 [Acidobacteria bacterium]|nr:MAG: hypothetical protein DMG77_08720 [Acidobacteriota bacterium]